MKALYRPGVIKEFIPPEQQRVVILSSVLLSVRACSELPREGSPQILMYEEYVTATRNSF